MRRTLLWWLLFAALAVPITVGAEGCGADDANTVSVLLNKGDGSFDERLNYKAGKGPAAVAIGDLNGDGKPDLVTANYNANTVSVFLADEAGVCVVPSVKGKTLSAAKSGVAGAGCRVAKIRRAYSKKVKRGHVISQAPPSRRVLRTGGKVNLVVSRGRKR
jgi:hypothetical protein